MDSLGIIAGNRNLPILLAKQARLQGIKRLVAVGFIGETSQELEALVDEMVWIRVGQLGRLIDTFKKRGITKCVMVGQISPKNLFELRPDLKAMMLLLRLRHKHAHSIFGAVVDELMKSGIEVIEPLPWLKPYMPGVGFHIGPPLSKEEQADLSLGYYIAKEIARLEIGQTVVIKDGVILAVEAFEGTDACIERGGRLAERKGAVVVKVAKEGHDMRFDIPCLGLTTIDTCVRAGIRVIGIERNKTLFLDQEKACELAKRYNISVVTVPVGDFN